MRKEIKIMAKLNKSALNIGVTGPVVTIVMDGIGIAPRTIGAIAKSAEGELSDLVAQRGVLIMLAIPFGQLESIANVLALCIARTLLRPVSQIICLLQHLIGCGNYLGIHFISTLCHNQVNHFIYYLYVRTF